MMNTDRLYFLFNRYLEQQASPEEKQELMQALADPKHAETLKQWIGERWEKQEFPEHLDAGQSQQLYEAIHEIIRPTKRIIRLYPWRHVAAAVLIAIAMFSGAYLGFFNRPGQSAGTAGPFEDIKAPLVSRATIALADGRYVYLDSINNGTLATQAKVKLVKLANGEIAYQIQEQTAAREMIYNTLSNPRGSRVAMMTLTDGTKVWLNAGSSLTYPVVFDTTERKVRISGEAYFEVAHQESHPFKVYHKNMEVNVLGTHFNVNAYDDENTIRTTLLEGSVQVSSLRPSVSPSFSPSVILNPGEQASLDAQGKLRVEEADTGEVIAWKNGYFKFNNADIETVMRQVARWYDVEVIYENKPTKLFRGAMSRNVSVLNVFKILEETGGVQFRIEGKTVTII